MLLFALLGSLSLYIFPTTYAEKTIELDEFLPLQTFAEMTQDPFTFERGESFLVSTNTKYDTKPKLPPKTAFY